MNAGFLERLIGYREKNRISFAKNILAKKIEHQFAVIGRRDLFEKYEKDMLESSKVEDTLLIEARAAREYWKIFGQKISKNNKIIWRGRRAQANDTVNRLLDIGYHYLVGHITTVFERIEIPVELGFFHKAQSKISRPFVYDFIEWLRLFVVDEVLLKLVSKKKRSVMIADQKIIAYLVFKIKQEFKQKYYHRELRYCITLDYWINLSLLSFIGTVNSNKDWEPIFPSLRHESRCKICKTKPPESNSGR